MSLASNDTPSDRLRRSPATRLARCAALIGAALLWWAPTAVDAQQLDRAVKVREGATATGAQSQGRIDKIADETDELVAEYRVELQQIEALRIYNEQLEKLLAAQDEEMVSLHEQIDDVTVIGRQITPLMLDMLAALENFVDLDVPFLLEERHTRVANLKSMMDRADVTDAEKYRRLLEAYQVENDYGRTIEAYRGELTNGGEARTVDFLRVGRVVLIYQTLDGAEIGIWDKQNRNWAPLDGSYRSAIRQGLRIARKQAAPDLLRLPVARAEEAK